MQKENLQMCIEQFKVCESPTVFKTIDKCVDEQHLKPLSISVASYAVWLQGQSYRWNCQLPLLENVKFKMDKVGVVAAFILYLKKAFDTVNHDIPINKLSNLKFPWKSLALIKSYLGGRTQWVSLSTLTSNLGVPQGSILGPWWFSLFINNLHGVMFESTVIYVHEKNKQQTAL